jgi:hypothetical protein
MTFWQIQHFVIALFPIPQGDAVISKEIRLRNLKENSKTCPAKTDNKEAPKLNIQIPNKTNWDRSQVLEVTCQPTGWCVK